MKNIPNLYNAMKTVEKACEPNEITIIGHGNTPTALELLGKCVDYINKMYGGDVLKELIALTHKKADEGCSCCECDEEEENENLLIVDIDSEDLYEAVRDEMPRGINDEYARAIHNRILVLINGDSFDEEDKEDYLDSVGDQISVIIEEECPFLSDDYVEDIANNLVDYIEDHIS